jgi:hypothetical protein
MGKFLFLGLFIISSFVSAQGIYGTKDTFFNSIFCKDYQCKLISSTFSKNTGVDGGVQFFRYRLIKPNLYGNIEIFIDRNINGVVIPSVSLYFPDANVTETDESRVKMLSDFVHTIIGKRIKPVDFANNCTYKLSSRSHYVIMAQGKTIVKAPNKPTSYVLYCEELSGDNPKTDFDDAIKFVISDDYHPR